MTKNEAISLRDKQLLLALATEIDNRGGSQSRTLLKRTNISDENEIERVITLGENHNYFSIGIGKRVELHASKALKDFNIFEKDYYSPIRLSLTEHWQKKGFENNELIIEDTSGRESNIVGRWTRPDLTLVSYKKYSYTVGSDFDIVTFEIKRPEESNVLAVFEALSHRSAATRSYVVFPMNKHNFEQQNYLQAQRVYDECARHGVGIIFAEQSDGSDHHSCHCHIEARRMEIDHEKSSNFLDAVLSDNSKSKIAKWK